jgi:hypothetical protein
VSGGGAGGGDAARPAPLARRAATAAPRGRAPPSPVPRRGRRPARRTRAGALNCSRRPPDGAPTPHRSVMGPRGRQTIHGAPSHPASRPPRTSST